MIGVHWPGTACRDRFSELNFCGAHAVALRVSAIAVEAAGAFPGLAASENGGLPFHFSSSVHSVGAHSVGNDVLNINNRRLALESIGFNLHRCASLYSS